LVHRDPQERWDLRGHRDLREILVSRVRRGRQDQLVRRGRQDQLVRRDPRERQDRRETPDPRDRKGRQGLRERLAGRRQAGVTTT
jgi:hypothetical protein